MVLKESYKNVVCIYKVTCIPNGKILIGSTTNLYKRVIHYRNDIHKDNPLKYYNRLFFNDLVKYGINNFEISIVKQFDDDVDSNSLKDEETYYMNKFDSVNPNIGYNIRQDLNGHYICANSTRKLKSVQTKLQWDLGIRSNHSSRMKDYWSENNNRKCQQSEIMRKNKTKYVYDIVNIKTGKYIKKDILYRDLYVNGYFNKTIAQMFTYINKKNKKTSINNIQSDDPNNYLNTIITGDCDVIRKTIK